MKPTVMTGLDVLKQSIPQNLKGKRLGLLANPASVDHSFAHASRVVNEIFPGQLTALFSPQHGFYAQKQDNMIESGHTLDPELNIPVFSLYSETRIPSRQMFDQIDILIIDIQDVGTRVYTFIYTISYCLETAAAMGKQVVILDRPNPVGGHRIEGNVLEPDYASFVGRFPIPMRHGMTAGEISLFFNREFNIGCDLAVIPLKGWNRQMTFLDTGLVFVPPSPNLPTPASCMVYPGQVIFEGTNVSEGRGTTVPFEQFGAPFLDSAAIATEAAGLLNGVHLRPVVFEPTSGKWHDQACHGFHIHVTDPDRYEPYFASLVLLQLIMKHHGEDGFEFKPPPYEYEFKRMPIDLILGSRDLRQKIESFEDLELVRETWQPELEAFKARSREYYLYE